MALPATDRHDLTEEPDALARVRSLCGGAAQVASLPRPAQFLYFCEE